MEGKDVFDIIRICICFKIPEDLAKNSPKRCDRCFTDFFFCTFVLSSLNLLHKASLCG